jgi:hypothetical protein
MVRRFTCWRFPTVPPLVAVTSQRYVFGQPLLGETGTVAGCLLEPCVF